LGNWRINPQTDHKDYILQSQGHEGENAWAFSMRLLGAEKGRCKEVEGEIHGVGLQLTKGVIPELFLKTVFNSMFDEISFSDDGVNDGKGEDEGNNKWACETAEEFREIFTKILRKSMEKNKPKISVEHLTRSPEKCIDKVRGNLSEKALDKFITEETLTYYKKAVEGYNAITGEKIELPDYFFIKENGAWK